MQAAPPLELTAPMAKGFDMGVVVVLDYLESLATFFTHPSHDEYGYRTVLYPDNARDTDPRQSQCLVRTSL